MPSLTNRGPSGLLSKSSGKLTNRGPAGMLSKPQQADGDGKADEALAAPAIPERKDFIAKSLSKVEIVDIKTLKPDPMNARLHPERNIDSIKLSLSIYGQQTPLVVRRKSRIVIKGNGTLEAMKQMSWTKAGVIWTDLDDVAAAGYGVADNRTAEHARWDFEVVGRIERMCSAAGQSIMPGWTPQEIVGLRLMLQPKAQGDPNEVPEPPREPLSSVGDLWFLGEHRLLCGDSTDPRCLKKVMNGKLATLLFTDPPYGVSIGAKNRLLNSVQKAGRCLVDIKDDSIAPKDLREVLVKGFNACYPHLADDCSVFVCSAQGGDLGLTMLLLMQDAKLPVKHVIIWKKNRATFSLNRLDYDYQHEPILFTWKRTHKKRDAGEFRTTIWEVDNPLRSPDHATTKPVELPVNAILRHTDPGDVVTDIYVGSGTTIIAAQQTARVCYAVEIEPRYVDVCLDRFSSYAGIDQVRERDGMKWSKLRATRDGKRG